MKRILIVGNLYALAKFLSTKVEKVYVVPGTPMMSDFAECVDIRENNPHELLKFAIDNSIDLTIAVSPKAIMSDIADVFQNNEKLIFAPVAKSADFAVYKSSAKRFLYKLHIPTPKFGIFDKFSVAFDYLKTANFPLIVKCDSESNFFDKSCCTTVDSAKNFAEDLFYSNEKRVVFEEYVWGHRFSIYTITDGYHALPFATVKNYNFTESGDGGIFTSGVGACVPDYKISFDIQVDIFQNVILKILESLKNVGKPYTGILRTDVVLLPDGSYSVLEFAPFLQDIDCQAVLNTMDENLLDLFAACANGFFADEYEDILLNDNVSVSCLVRARKEGIVIPNLDLVESEISFLNTEKNKYFEYISAKGNNIVLTSCAKTFSRAKKILKEDLDLINFDGMRYRCDICN